MTAVRRLPSRELGGLLLGLVVLIVVVVLDSVVGGRNVPLTATLLAPLLASALAGPLVVGPLALATTAIALALAVRDDLQAVELVSRVLLVGVAGLLSVAVAVTRTRREQQLQRIDRVAALAHTLQRGLLPGTPSTATVSVTTVYRPGQRDLLLGGDFIDVLELADGSTGFCIGDVSGHGAEAAALGSALRAGWRTQALTGADPAAWLAALDRLLAHEVDGDEQFATVLVGTVSPDGQSVLLANAGHPLPLRLTDTARVVPLKAGPPLGLSMGGDWDVQHLVLGPRWGLLLYTDGLIEGRRAPGSSARYGEHSLATWLGDSPSLASLSRYDLDRLLAEVETANGAPLEDDVAIVLLRSALHRRRSQRATPSAGPPPCAPTPP